MVLLREILILEDDLIKIQQQQKVSCMVCLVLAGCYSHSAYTHTVLFFPQEAVLTFTLPFNCLSSQTDLASLRAIRSVYLTATAQGLRETERSTDQKGVAGHFKCIAVAQTRVYGMERDVAKIISDRYYPLASHCQNEAT